MDIFGSDGERASVITDGAGRVARVVSTLGRAAEILGDSRGLRYWLEAVESVTDHKGMLEVRWLRSPTVGEISALERAWAEKFEYITQHFYPGCHRLVYTDGEKWKVSPESTDAGEGD